VWVYVAKTLRTQAERPTTFTGNKRSGNNPVTQERT